MIGAPRKYTVASWPVPIMRALSTSSSSIRRYQSSRGATQVV